MRKVLLILGALALTLAAVPGTTAGQVPAEDSVVAHFNDPEFGITDFDVFARSGPSGENPTGDFRLRINDVGRRFEGTATCLRVDGRQATLGLRLSVPTGQVAAVAGFDDAGPTAPFEEGLFFNLVPRVLGPTECPLPDDPILHVNNTFAIGFGLDPPFTDTITIHDAAAQPSPPRRTSARTAAGATSVRRSRTRGSASPSFSGDLRPSVLDSAERGAR